MLMNSVYDDTKKTVYIFSALLLVFLFLLYLKTSLLIVPFVFLVFLYALSVIPISSFSFLVFVLFIISILPSYSWGTRYDFFHGLYISEPMLLVLFAGFLFFILFDTVKLPRYVYYPSSRLDFYFSMFLILAVFAALRGLFETDNISIIKIEIILTTLYIYFPQARRACSPVR